MSEVVLPSYELALLLPSHSVQCHFGFSMFDDRSLNPINVISALGTTATQLSPTRDNNIAGLGENTMERKRFEVEIVNVGTHGVKQQAPSGLEKFLREFFSIVFETYADIVSARVEVQNAHIASPDVLFKPTNVVQGGGIRARIRTPDSPETRQCTLFFTEGKADAIFQILQEYCRESPMTPENWAIIAEKGSLPDPLADFWTEERLELFIQQFLIWAASNVLNVQQVCVTLDQLAEIFRKVGYDLRGKVREVPTHLMYLGKKGILAPERAAEQHLRNTLSHITAGQEGHRSMRVHPQSNQAGQRKAKTRIFPGTFLAEKCIQAMQTAANGRTPEREFSALFSWLVQEMRRLHDIQEDKNKQIATSQST
jgi:hypothetical protein